MKKQNNIRCAMNFTVLACFMTALFCAPKPVMLDFNSVPDNERCQYMKDACKEAEAFQANFEAMGREEKEEAKVILNSLISQCEDAQAMCKQTM